jgi:hypothetical protein
MDDQEAAEVSHQLIKETLRRISKGDKEAALELAQLYMTRVVKLDVAVMLAAIEGLALQSAALGSSGAKKFLRDWPELRGVLERRLHRTLRSGT